LVVPDWLGYHRLESCGLQLSAFGAESPMQIKISLRTCATTESHLSQTPNGNVKPSPTGAVPKERVKTIQLLKI
jgi:hypothetical protein